MYVTQFLEFSLRRRDEPGPRIERVDTALLPSCPPELGLTGCFAVEVFGLMPGPDIGILWGTGLYNFRFEPWFVGGSTMRCLELHLSQLFGCKATCSLLANSFP